MRIELPVDREQLNQVFGAISTSDAEATLRVRFEVQDQAAVREAVLADATRMARRNAEAMASAAGCQLGKVQSMDYGWSEIRFHSMDYSFEERPLMARMVETPDIEHEKETKWALLQRFQSGFVATVGARSTISSDGG